jgi:ABC-2 type transport system ATP-binding protein
VDDAAINVESLRKRFDRIEALKSVSLAVKAGEIFGLLGANGAGKTTLIRILVGSSRPTAGAARVLGLEPIRDARALRRQIGYMPQAPALYEDLSPRDNIRFFGRAQRVPDIERRIDEVLQLMGLSARAHDPVYGFSGGMKQRASLACALVHQPRLLLLDEPTAGMDPKLRALLWQHFRQLADAGTTMLVSTHQMDEALYCDRLAIMRDGVVLACDTPHNLLTSGQATIKIWRNEAAIAVRVSNYPVQLPRVLQRYQLDPSITRIEIEENTLETVVLRLINASQPTTPPEKEDHDAAGA